MLYVVEPSMRQKRVDKTYMRCAIFLQLKVSLRIVEKIKIEHFTRVCKTFVPFNHILRQRQSLFIRMFANRL